MKRIAFLLLLFVGLPLVAQINPKSGLSSSINKYGQTLYYINNYYIDTVKFEKLTEDAIIKVLSELDPHSSYISSDDVKAMNEPLEGKFEGVGIEFAIIKDTLTVQAPLSGGPCETVGIMAGDKIVAVDGEYISGTKLTNERVFKYLRGPKGTKVNLSIQRRGEDQILLFTVVRDKIPINSVDAAYSPEPGLFYIKLSRFAQDSKDEIVNALALSKEPIKGLILDLRGNSGGYLLSAIQIADEFLKEGELIVYTEGRSFSRQDEFATGNGNFQTGNIVLLIDENSASSSEIVSGAVQDQDRGIIIGRRSFGKGLVQQQMPLGDGSLLRLTIARYHTPSGRVIQSPYEEGNIEKYYSDYYRRFANGESYSRDSIHFPDSLKYKTLHKGRTVFGGGGIMPDIFVPQDTSYYTDYYALLLRRGVVIEFINDYCDINRSTLKAKYKDFREFNSSFQISETLFTALVDFADKKGIKPDPKQIEISKSELKIYMKALIASSIIGRDSFYRIINKENDPTFLKAIEVLKDWDKYSKEIL